MRLYIAPCLFFEADARTMSKPWLRVCVCIALSIASNEPNVSSGGGIRSPALSCGDSGEDCGVGLTLWRGLDS